MPKDALVQMVFIYLIAIMVLVGSFSLIYTNRGDSAQAWLAIGSILGYIFRDSAGAAAVRNSERQAAAIQAATPNTTIVAAVPPAQN